MKKTNFTNEEIKMIHEAMSAIKKVSQENEDEAHEKGQMAHLIYELQSTMVKDDSEGRKEKMEELREQLDQMDDAIKELEEHNSQRIAVVDSIISKTKRTYELIKEVEDE